MAKKESSAPPSPEEAAIGARLRKLIESQGLTPRAVAEALDYSEQGIGQVLNGRRVSAFTKVLDWCDCLRLTPNELLGVDEELKPSNGSLDPHKTMLSFAAMLRDLGHPKEVALEIARLALRSAQEPPPEGHDPAKAIELTAVTRLRDVLARE